MNGSLILLLAASQSGAVALPPAEVRRDVGVTRLVASLAIGARLLGNSSAVLCGNDVLDSLGGLDALRNSHALAIALVAKLVSGNALGGGIMAIPSRVGAQVRRGPAQTELGLGGPDLLLARHAVVVALIVELDCLGGLGGLRGAVNVDNFKKRY